LSNCVRFLLPVLQIRTILGQVTKSDIRRALGVLSGDISEAYDKAFQTIQRLPSGQRDLAMKSLLWITYAKRQLCITELRCALGTRITDRCFDEDNMPTSKSILKSCSELISTENDSSELRLVHYTLQHYIRNQCQSFFSHAESLITQTCLTYLLFDVKVEDYRWLGKSSLLNYAMEHWGNHARSVPTEEFEHLALRLLTDTSRLQTLYGIKKKITGLHITSGFGLTELSASLIHKKASLESKDDQRETPLHKASSYGRVEAARLLLENGAKVNARNAAFATPLFIATSAGDLGMTELLLDHGAAIDKRGVDGWTVLHKAADCGVFPIVSLLLRRGASIAAESARGLTALHRAAGRGHADVAKLLLDYNANIDAVTKDGWSPLHGACSSGQESTVKLLLESGADINLRSFDGRTALHRACRGGYPTTVGILLEYRADVMLKDSHECLPLHRAAKGGHITVIQQLLQQHPEQLLAVDKSGRTARKEAQINGFHMTENLLKEMESILLGIPIQEQSDFERAIDLKDEKKVAMLLSDNTNLELPNSNGLKPLHQALLLDSHGIASLLLQHGADVNGKTITDNWRPLHYAALKGSPDAVRLCIEHGAVMNARTKDGYTALHKACQSGNIETVKLLLENGADIESKDDWGWRPLHKAASNGHEVVLKTLLEHGANIYARTKDDHSVQVCAARGGHHSLVEFIREKRCG
jgi:ankyrin repeat protein